MALGSRLRRLRGPDGLNRVRRHIGQRVDQALALTRWKLGPLPKVAPFDGDPRFALFMVNFSRTRLLKLLLLTLGEQQQLSLVERVIVADNASRDGGVPFLRALAAHVPRLNVVERHAFLDHARGMRSGLRSLERVERGVDEEARANVLLFCDTDVVFRNPETLLDLGASIVAHDAAFAGELRGTGKLPFVHASFLVVRRDWYYRRSGVPWLYHPTPAVPMQRQMWRAGATVSNFPTYLDGYVIHKGRSGIAAAREHQRRHPHATAERHVAHFMHAPEGADQWAEIEGRYAHLLERAAEPELLEVLAQRLAALGASAARAADDA